jgi:hypothetical protein
MLTGIALPLANVPLSLIERHNLTRRLHDRGGKHEVWFLFQDVERVLLVLHDGQLQIMRWGTRRGESRVLPLAGWVELSTVESGGWVGGEPAEVVIPVTLGLDRGIWYPIRQGVRALPVAEAERVCVYPLVEPATHGYAIMTKSNWAPCLVQGAGADLTTFGTPCSPSFSSPRPLFRETFRLVGVLE